MASSNSILQKVQQAARDFVRDAGLSWVAEASIVSGITRGPAADDMDADVSSTELPAVICQCQQASAADSTPSGNWLATLAVHVRSHADETTEDQHLARTGEVFDLFMDGEDTITGLSALADFTAEQVEVDTQDYNASGRVWTSTLTLRVRCRGRD